MANQNDKSASALQLQQPFSSAGKTSGSTMGKENNGPETSVDRWAVVMELLAQSRKKPGEPGSEGSGSAGKRHSKQLDKFKLAARSAAAVSKHQRQRGELLHQTGLLAAATPSPTPTVVGATQPEKEGNLDLATQQRHKIELGPEHQHQTGGYFAPELGGSSVVNTQHQQQQQGSQEVTQASLPSGATGNESRTSQASVLVHHTKSLPIGGDMADKPVAHGVGLLMPTNEQMNFQRQQQYYSPPMATQQQTAHPQAHSSGPHGQQSMLTHSDPYNHYQLHQDHLQEQQRGQSHGQLLSISSQQLQSTSGK